MKWTLAEIETFLAVMDVGTISGAAARADLSKSVVSKRISDFEATLGAALFTRRAGRLTPTESAHALAERLRAAMAELTAATESVNLGTANLRGRLAVSAPMSFGVRHLGPHLASFAEAHPDLDLVIEYDDQIIDLSRMGFDIGLRIGVLRDSTLMSRKLSEDPRAIVASPDYLARSGPLRSIDDLPHHQAVGYLNRRLGDVWSFVPPSAVPRPSRVTANNGDAIRDMAIGGLGLAVLPMFIVHDALTSGRLVRVLPDAVLEPLQIAAVWPRVRPLPRKIRMFVDHLVKAFERRAPWEISNPPPDR